MNRSQRSGKIILWLMLATLSVISLFPFLWLFLVSLKASGTTVGFPPVFIPHPPAIDNYLYVFGSMPLVRFFSNSILFTAVGVLLDLLFASMAGYALARLNFRGKNFAFFLILSTLFLPGHMGLIVNFVTMARFNLADTYFAVWLPQAVTVLGIFLMRQTFLVIPKELEDAARLDGASEWAVFWKIMLPLAKPGLITLGILDFTLWWNSFLWPLIILKDPQKYPLSVGLLYLQGLFANRSLAIAAGAVLALLPILIVFLFGQKYFVKGTFQGSLK